MKFLHLSIVVFFISCGQTPSDQENTQSIGTDSTKTNSNAIKNNEILGNPKDFVPNGFVIYETIYGDLNNDSIEDCVLVIKGADKSKVITDEIRGQLDRNRRGIIVLTKQADAYKFLLMNDDCFASENEDGGVYYAPELSIEIKKCKLYVFYRHGRYGFWGYVFRYQNSDFELIGYSSSDNHGPIVEYETSINFSTKEKIVKVNTNLGADPETEAGNEVFETTKTKISVNKLFKLSEIKDFEQFELSIFRN